MSWSALAAEGATPRRTPAVAAPPLTLEDCIAIALKQNFDIRLNRLDYNNAVQDAEIARAVFDPAVTANFTSDHTQSAVANSTLQGAPQPKSTTATLTFGLTDHLPTGADITLGLDSTGLKTNSSFSLLNPSYDSDYRITLRQPLLKNGGLHANLIPLELSKIAIGDSDLRTRKGILATLAAVEMAYWDLQLARQEERFAGEDVETSEKLLAEVKVRSEAGLSNGLDLLRAESSVASKQEALITNRQATANRSDALLQLLGLRHFDDVAVSRTVSLPVLGGSPADPQSEFALAQTTDPDYLTTLDGIKRGKLGLDQARNNLLPSFDAVASGSLSGQSDTYFSAYDRAAHGDGRDWSVGFEVRIPLTFREERARLQQAKNNLATAQLQVEQAAQKLAITVRTACRALESSRQRVAASSASLRLSQNQYNFAEEQFAQGLVEFRDVLDAQQALSSERVAHLRARVEVVRAEVELNRLDGALLARHGLAWKDTRDARKPMTPR